MTHPKHCKSDSDYIESDEIDTSDSDYMPFDGAHQSTVSRKIQPSSRRRKYSDSSSSYFSDSSSSSDNGSDDDSSSEGDDRIYKLRVPRSAWVFYNTQKISQLLDTHPDAGIGERTKMSAKVWNTLDEDERDQWEEMAAAEQLQYEECRKLLEKNGTFDEIPSSWKRVNRKAERGKVTTKHKKGKKKKKTKKPTKKKDKKKKKKKKKEGDDRIYKLRVPRSAWVFYNTQKISQLLDTHPDAGIGERTKMSAKVWNTLDENERDQWKEMAAAEKLKYEECRKLLEKNGTFDEIPSSWKRINRKAEAERRGKVTTKHKKGKKKKKTK
eukprot:434878_1